jgi:hypothetical protein
LARKAVTRCARGAGGPTASASAPQPKAAAGGAAFRAKVRMYRQGLGDCFLITLPRSDGSSFFIVIDCGVILGTTNAAKVMNDVVQDLIATTNGHIDLMIATHEHWDHLSGMVQAKALWQDASKLKVDQVWVGWTENPADELANKLRTEHQSFRANLATAVGRMRAAGVSESADEVMGMLDLFGAAGSGTTTDALNVVKGLSKNVRYCLPQDAPVTLAGTSVRAYILGPPHDEKMIKKYNPSMSEPETYGMDAMNAAAGMLAVALDDSNKSVPFDDRFQIPLEPARKMPFFQQHYWGEAVDSEEENQDWRRIDTSWLDASSSLALQLDSATNNTCVVLALELDGGDVLLFAADAQVGNWLSWQTLNWNVNGSNVTGPDLLKRTIFYKVGHHGSHNATLRTLGLEEMAVLKYAFVPVNHEMALKKRWGQMPFTPLLERLGEKTEQQVVRIDQDVPQKMASIVKSAPLYHEITL